MSHKILNNSESLTLYKRLKKADEDNSLLHILRMVDGYLNLNDFHLLYNELKKGNEVKINNNILYFLNEGLNTWENDNKNPNTNVQVTIKGFHTIEEASEFCSWYSGQGEQNASIWFECRVDDGRLSTKSMYEEATVKTSKNNVDMFLKMY